MIALATNPTIELSASATRTLIRMSRAPRALSHVEWAEKYVRIPTGEYKNQPWRRDRLPWARILFEQLDDPRWIKVVTTGPTQSGKTQQCFSVPTLRRVREFPQHNIVLGFPDDDMADKKFRTDLLPIIRASPGLRDLEPQGGAGSRGGKVKDSLTFGNGVIAALMSKGASDEGKAGFTAPYGAVTEAGGFSEGQDTSVESDPLRQILGRLLAFKRRNRRMMIEGTVKIETMLPWSLRGEDDGALISSQSRLLSPCPHCGVFICPEREHFTGWEEAKTEDQACNESSFFCPECGQFLSEEDRKASNQDLRIVHRGQTIDKNGDIHGDHPPTSTLWFRYSQWHNLLTSYDDLAAAEWECVQQADGTQERDNLERARHQQTWCIPFKSSLTENEPITASAVAKRTGSLDRGILPENTVGLTIGVDLGKHKGWWVAIAWLSTGERYIVAYGDFPVMPADGKGQVHQYIVAALNRVIKPLADAGFPVDGKGVIRKPDAVWIDSGYHPDAVAEFVRGTPGRVLQKVFCSCRGRGESATVKWLRGIYINPKRVTQRSVKIGREWHAEANHKRRVVEYTFNADYWKINVHEGLRGGSKGAGKITLYAPSREKEHDQISNHFAAEQLSESWEPGKGETHKWEKNGQNHLLDSAAMASAAGDSVGFRLQEVEDPPEEPTEADSSGGCAATSEPANFYANLLTSL